MCEATATPMSKLGALSAKHKRFVQEYMVDLNGTQAAIRAGYSPKSASEQAYDLLRKPQIQEALAEQVRARSERCKLTADNVIKELMTLAFGNLGDYHVVTEDGKGVYLDLSKISNEQWKALKRAKTKRYSDGRGEDAREILETEIEMHDKKGPLIELGKHLGLFRGEGNLSKEADVAKAVADKEQRHHDHLAHFADRYRRALPAPKQPKPSTKAEGKAKAKVARASPSGRRGARTSQRA
jgi:phage terminase small subunit